MSGRAEASPLRIRPEAAADIAAIAAVNRRAFDGTFEAELVGRLRAEGAVVLSLVAEREDRVVGHILLSRLDIAAAGRKPRASALAPMAVVPQEQGKGIGSALVRAAVTAAQRAGEEVIVVLGHPGFYPRFGFSAARAARLAAPFSGDAFMALEIVPGALGDGSGTVAYPSAFGIEDRGPGASPH